MPDLPAGPLVRPRPDEPDETIRAALADAELPPLLPALALATGDLSLLRDELRPPAGAMLLAQGGLSPEAQEATRRLAFDVLVRMRDAGPGAAFGSPPALGRGGDAVARRLLEFAVGDEVDGDHLPLLWEELTVDDPDPRAPAWRAGALAPGRATTAIVVGAGMSGLLAAHRLGQAGVEVVVVEKNPEVGGTWWDNVYPGCRVDVPNAFYSYSFAQRDDWPFQFTPQPFLLDYLRDCADRLGLREKIRFCTEVTEARFDPDRTRWRAQVRTAGGRTEVLEATILVSAVGQLNRPSWPDIPGRGTFAGESFHSARWRDDVDLRGRRVAVIGSAASATQLLPHVAERAAHVHLIQRTPNWLLPSPGYQLPTPDGLRWLQRNVPYYRQWHRTLQFWRIAQGLDPAMAVVEDPATGARRPNEANDLVREILTAYLTEQFADRPDLLAAEIPAYPPLAKRPLLDDGSWAATLKRDNVTLVTAPITAITPGGVRVGDDDTAVDVDADVIIYATGFQASEFLTPMRIVGPDGTELHAAWAGEPRAHLGVTVPGFPNLFCLYGPNTNVVANGSIIFMVECSVTHLLDCVRLMVAAGSATIECDRRAFETFNAEIDAANRRTVWGASDVHTWYKNASGRVTQNWPYGMFEYWRRTRTADPASYRLA